MLLTALSLSLAQLCSTMDCSHQAPLPMDFSIKKYLEWVAISYSSILHMVVYVFPYYSLNSSHPFLPLLYLQVCFLYLCIYSCPANMFISTTILDSIYTCYYMEYAFLFQIYITLHNRL